MSDPPVYVKIPAPDLYFMQDELARLRSSLESARRERVDPTQPGEGPWRPQLRPSGWFAVRDESYNKFEAISMADEAEATAVCAALNWCAGRALSGSQPQEGPK